MAIETLRAAASAGRVTLSEAEGKSLLAARDISVPRSVVLRHGDDPASALAGMRPPFAAKVIAASILHKSDVGGVSLGLTDSAAVAAAIETMAARPGIAGAAVEGWLVEEMAPPGQEIVIGGLRDTRFGPMLMVGLGGIFVEVFEDVAFRLCPVSEAVAREMLTELRGYGLLTGVRGREAMDIDALVGLMLQIGGENGLLMEAADYLSELDLNPVIVGSQGLMVADARFILGIAGETPRRVAPDAHLPPLERFRPLFQPGSIAVMGASAQRTGVANNFIQRMERFGFGGEIYPIHPSAPEIEGLPAFPDLNATPGPVDYAYIAIAGEQIPDALAAAPGRCRMAQVISSGFAEIEEGVALQAELVEKAHLAGTRILGPNCLGTYSPRGGMSFASDAPKEPGRIGIVAQSGGLSTDIIKRGQWRGLRFSGLVTLGNASDVSPTELLAYYFDDPETKAIGLYLEDIGDGRAFFDLLRSPAATKPVVILKGGQTAQGSAAAASHTGALAGDARAWEALAAQTGVVLVPHLNAFLDALLALQCLTLRPENPTHRVTLFGNGGGTSVLGSDAFARVGLDVSPFDPDTIARLEALGLPPGTSVRNPVDTPVFTLQEKDGWVAGEILDIIYESAAPQAVAMHLNLAAFAGRGDKNPVENLLSVAMQVQQKWPGRAHFALALRTDGSPQLEEAKRRFREQARAVDIPVYDEIPELAAALAAVSHLERRMGRG